MPGMPEEDLPELSLNQRELLSRLGWFVHLRWLTVGSIALALGVESWREGLSREMLPILKLGGIVSAYNLIFTCVNRRVRRAPSRGGNIAFAWLQILADLATLTLVIHRTGGISSAFVVFYIVPMVAAGELLRRWHGYCTATLASLALDLMGYLEAGGHLGHYYYEGFTLGSGPLGQNEPGRWLSVCFLYNAAFFATVYMTSSIAERLRFRERESDGFNRHLEAVSAAKSDFMRMTGHEMRTPLVAVGGLLDLLARKIPPDQNGLECLGLIQRSKSRMQAMGDMVDDLLEYSRLQAVLPAAERSRFDLAGVARTASEELEVLAASKEIAVTLQLDPCEFEGNREQMLSLVKNLLSNSLQYTPRSGKVEVRLHREEGRAILETQDSGIGISTEAVGRVFDEFFRTSEARQLVPGGTGLGLALCKRIVENHGGSIEVQSKPGQGTLFRVTLPLRSA